MLFSPCSLIFSSPYPGAVSSPYPGGPPTGGASLLLTLYVPFVYLKIRLTTYLEIYASSFSLSFR
jgi:hypothetical protein